MLLNSSQNPLGRSHKPFTMVWNDILGLYWMDANDLLWMNRVC